MENNFEMGNLDESRGPIRFPSNAHLASKSQFALNRYMNQPSSLSAYRMLSNTSVAPDIQPKSSINSQQKGPIPALVQPVKL